MYMYKLETFIYFALFELIEGWLGRTGIDEFVELINWVNENYKAKVLELWTLADWSTLRS